MNRILLAVVLSIAACGGDLRPPSMLTPDAVGSWAGMAAVSIGYEPPRTYETMLFVSDGDGGVQIEGICPDGSGVFVPIGFDGRYTWSGRIECQPSWLEGCAVTIEYNEVVVDVSTGTMNIRASGTAHRAPLTSPCGDATEVASVFTLSKTTCSP